jgi:penicillin-binding protein 1C
MRDNWCIGFSPRYTVAVWVGNFEGDSMHDVSGVTGAAPAWLSIMNWLHRDGADTAPTAPAGVVASEITFEGDIEPARREWFLAGTALDRIDYADRGRRARIVSPSKGVVIALDPDIPAGHQSVRVEARGVAAGAVLELDGAPLDAVAGNVDWMPTPGAHVLRIVDGGRTLDEVAFDVRAGGVR